jgi:hypothetical protein
VSNQVDSLGPDSAGDGLLPTAHGPAVRRAILVSIVRGLALSAAAVLLSVVMDLSFVPQPLRLPFGLAFIVLWIVAYIVYVRHQLKKIRSAPYPMIRAWETLLVGAVLFVTIFANAYHQIAQLNPQAFSEDLDLFTSYYFTVTVLGTVGFGDITPVTTFARAISMVQMIVDLGIIAFSVRLLTSEVKQARGVRAASSDAA